MKLNDEAAVPYLEHAVEIDPNFATAYATLGVVYSNLTQMKKSSECLQKAYELRERASERERLYILAHYYGEATGEIAKQVEVYEEWNRTYPRDSVPLDNMSLEYLRIGQPEKALNAASEALRLDVRDGYSYQNLAPAYVSLDRYDEAKSVIEQAAAQKLESLGTRLPLLDLAFLRGDEDGMQREVSRVAGTSDEPFLLTRMASAQHSLGKVTVSRKTLQQAVGEAARDAAYGYSDPARREVNEALQLQSGSKDARVLAARTLALLGDAAKAQKLIDDLGRQFPSQTMMMSVQIPIVRAILHLQRKAPAEAITALEPARPYEIGSGPTSANYLPIYLRGLAFLNMRDGTKAANEFQRILDHRGGVGVSVAYPLAQLNLARAYVLQGDKTKARTAYQDFFARWKEADADIPILKEAKSEYAKLQ